MKKKSFLSIIFIALILSSSLAFSQESNETKIGDELLVRFHSFGKQASVDLKKYLGAAEEYYYMTSKNVTVAINQEEGIAVLTANPGWDGVETIIFTTSKPISLIRFKETEERVITDEDIARVFQDLINKSFSSIADEIEIQKIRNIETNLKGGEIIINLNDEAEIFFRISRNKPETTLNILIPNKGPPELAAFEISRLNPYIFAVLIFVFLYAFRKKIKTLLFTTEIEVDVKNQFLIDLLNIQRLYNMKEKEEKLFGLLKRFFSILGINKNTSRFDLNRILDKKSIRGDLKQQTVYLFSKFAEYESQDKNEVIKLFKEILLKI